MVDRAIPLLELKKKSGSKWFKIIQNKYAQYVDFELEASLLCSSATKIYTFLIQIKMWFSEPYFSPTILRRKQSNFIFWFTIDSFAIWVIIFLNLYVICKYYF